MGKTLRSLTKKNEFFVLLTVVAIIIIISSLNSAFATFSSMTDILRSGTELGIFAVGMFIIIVAGGIDVSCAAIAMFAMFTTTKILFEVNYEGGIWLAYLMASAFGLAWGIVNGLVITRLKIPPLIGTLATNGIIMGVLLFFIGSREISQVPAAMRFENKNFIYTVENEFGIKSSLPFTFLVLVAILVITFILLRYTMLGRNIYAVGGDTVSAERAGIRVRATQMFTYAYGGIIFGMAGMVHTIMMANSNPVDLIGKEMLTIATVVIGGTRLTGGRGTLTGTMLGVILVTIISNSLILVGVPSFWQRFVTGLVIVIGASISAYQELRVNRQMHVEVAE